MDRALHQTTNPALARKPWPGPGSRLPGLVHAGNNTPPAGGYSAWLLTRSIRLASRWAEVLGRGARRRVVGCCDFDGLV